MPLNRAHNSHEKSNDLSEVRRWVPGLDGSKRMKLTVLIRCIYLIGTWARILYILLLLRLKPQGCWRKITVDDSLPFDKENNLLLPATTNQAELWPVLLAKGLIKLANTE